MSTSGAGMSSVLGVIGSTFAVSIGVPAQNTVTIQCILGRSPGKHFVLNGYTDLSARYTGMRNAFGKEKELFVPARVGDQVQVPRMNHDDYDALLRGAEHKQLLCSEGTNPNKWVQEGLTFPMWRWSLDRYGLFTWILGPVSLILLPAVMTWKFAATGKFPLESLIFTALFAIAQAFAGFFLDVRRSISYVKVGEQNVSQETTPVWNRLRAKSNGNTPAGPQDAVQDLRNGVVRSINDDLAIPVMVLQPTVGFELAEWLSMLSPLRLLLFGLSISPLVPGVTDGYAIAYTVVAGIQSHLQTSYAKSFLVAIQTTEIFWFRRLPAHAYDELSGDLTFHLS
ncbi:hypothetical protein LTR29_003761 [Friedmanniomyces endolithicus]|uniref:Uncharacterized protein n=1 Tax=Friedmanniomyces endolithicus TaxID=329885 RepID=A0A4U0U312_9PEZI|nr:hypothetical protein LTS09_009929 [Friedmanniomyces endolithicus]KAK0944748.1 hypothetical protein LTR29_003761 [Friedmanniomyces endolithicus]TKA29393.1 hypothetical protein B0A54_16277 [Friedmanniomyces endolithicus]